MKHLIIFLIFISSFQGYAQTADKFIIGTIEAESGSKISGDLIVEEGIDQGTFIPITIFNGSKQGPVLTLIAGHHGTEYVPIISMQNLAAKLDPEELTGTIIMVHVANIPSFSKRTVYNSPVDNKNINRVYPGKKDGTQSERIAYTITHEIIDKSDYLIDLHGGEYHENMANFAIFNSDCPDTNINQSSLKLAKAFGLNYVLDIPFDLVPDSVIFTYCDIAAIRRGVSAIAVELGGQGIASIEALEIAERGIINIMREFGLLEGLVFHNKQQVYIGEDVFIQSNFDGIIYTLVDCGQTITIGDLIGYTTDYFGNIVEEYHAPFTSIVLMNFVSPPVNKGDNIFWIAKKEE